MDIHRLLCCAKVVHDGKDFSFPEVEEMKAVCALAPKANARVSLLCRSNQRLRTEALHV